MQNLNINKCFNFNCNQEINRTEDLPEPRSPISNTDVPSLFVKKRWTSSCNSLQRGNGVRMKEAKWMLTRLASGSRSLRYHPPVASERLLAIAPSLFPQPNRCSLILYEQNSIELAYGNTVLFFQLNRFNGKLFGDNMLPKVSVHFFYSKRSLNIVGQRTPSSGAVTTVICFKFHC